MLLEILLDEIEDSRWLDLVSIFLRLRHLVLDNVLINEIDNFVVGPFLVKELVPRLFDFLFLSLFILLLLDNDCIENVIDYSFLMVDGFQVADVNLLAE